MNAQVVYFSNSGNNERLDKKLLLIIQSLQHQSYQLTPIRLVMLL
ncbi:Hypothetical protein zj316_2885 [Lactiplantibacillus plantarum ZJ316]|nr:Hypothetical protein zj316_2885 [Lactiplantibacillus plantarum ZJ316]